ncbi:MAG: DUF3014 domain-containing protein [Proteobacteria bacterium]|nr:DUF3014 domain-containing protein [Pseudomonadota bacterium]
MHDRSSQWLIPLILTGAAAAALWYYWYQANTPTRPAAVPAPPPVVQELAATGPRYPLPQTMPGLSERENLPALPPLDQSDAYFRLDLVGLFGSGITELLVDTAVIEKIVATIDNLPRDHVAERIRPLGGVVGPYLADGQDGSGQYTVNAANHQRYDFLVTLLGNADLVALVEVYRRFYPLFQDAYAGLGYPHGYFNDRAVEVIDHLLETPEVRESLELVRPHVLYEYADPQLEALSSGQKLLLRIGNEHALRVKQFLEELRVLIIEPAA